MRKAINLLLWLFAGISSLLVTLVALLFLVDVNLYRTPIERHVSTAFGRDIVFEGPLSLEPSLLPRFAVKGLKIANPDWASRPFLAVVDKFDIRVSLLPLLRGELQIISLEFHGVDLLLENTAEGANNFTFGDAGKPAVLPAIDHMSLNDVTLGYAAPRGQLRRLHLEEITARKVPGQAVELEARARANALPVVVSLHGKPAEERHPDGPWQISLTGQAGDLSLQIEGSIADPTDWRQGDFQLDVKSPRLDDLETLSGYTLPEAGPMQLGTNIRFKLDEYVSLGDLTARIGASDVHGKLHWDLSVPRPNVRAQLASQRLDAADLNGGNSSMGGSDAAEPRYLNKPFDIGVSAAIDIDVEIDVQRLDGLAKPVRDIELTARTDRQHLRLADVKATVDGTQIVASATLPWGERLTKLAADAVSLQTLLQHAELDVHARAADTKLSYATTLMGRPLELAVFSVKANARPGDGLKISAEAALNGAPLTAKLRGEPLAELLQRTTGPWNELALELRGQGIRFDATGSVAEPFDAAGFDVSYTLNVTDIAALLPLRGALSLTGRYADHADRRVFDALEVTLGRSDVAGRVAIREDGQRFRLVAKLDSSRLHLDEALPLDETDSAATAGWDQPLHIGGLGAFDLAIELRVGRLEGLAKPLRDIRLGAQASDQTLTLAPLQGTLEDVQLDGRVQLPWGERLTELAKDGIRVQRLAQQIDFTVKAQPPDGMLRYRTNIVHHPVELGLAGIELSARPGEALQASASAALDDKPLQVNLQAQPLAHLLKRASGPWRDLDLEVRGDDIRFKATGSVAKPLEARGFDIHYALQGDEIEALLPLFDYILPLEGPYSLTGHFADLPDQTVFDELKIKSGDSDIGGRISVYHGPLRPRVVARFNSEQFYLSKLLPVSETQAADTRARVIPDYDLPIELMRTFDGELEFKGKRLRTTAGDLGDISFRATLQDGVFSIDPFRVRGWAGARIESDLTIDASQNPPPIALNWIARQLSYGVLLEQAGFAETVEGDLDVTLRLSGKGRSRYEFLGGANGQLIIVGQDGRFGSRRLDLWASDLATAMLPWEWGSEDVTDLNCLVARISIDDGLASSDELLVDSRRITIAAAGTLDLESEALDLVFAPRPKRTSLVSLSSPVHVTGTLAAPEVAVTLLPRNRMAAAGTGALAGLINPGYLIFAFTQTGSGQANPCAAAVERALAMKGRNDETGDLPTASPPRFSLLPGCTRARQRPEQ